MDPIDGTANFVRGIAHFCVSIAFVLDGAIRLGAILQPTLGELHFARLGRGATLNGRAIRVAETHRVADASGEIGWSTRIPDAANLGIVGATLGASVRRAGSGALGLAYVADGRSDAYAELHMNSWDALAGLLIVAEAGGPTASWPMTVCMAATRCSRPRRASPPNWPDASAFPSRFRRRPDISFATPAKYSRAAHFPGRSCAAPSPRLSGPSWHGS